MSNYSAGNILIVSHAIIISDALQDVERFLHKNETALMKLRQSYLSSISPDTIVLTDKRVIIIHNSFWGLYTGHNIISPTRISTVMLDNIMGTTNSNGKILASIQIRIRGSGGESESLEGGWHIEGIKIENAQKFSNLLEEYLELDKEKTPEIDLAFAKSLIAEDKTSIIWLGVEPTDYVSYLLGIDVKKITRVNPIDITNMSPEGLKDFQGKVLSCYSGNVSAQIAKLLKDEYNVKTFILKGGLMGAIKDKDNNISSKK